MYRYSAYQAGESGGLSGRRTVPTSHCPEARWQDNPGAAATSPRAAVMRGDRAAISDADGHTGGGRGIPRALMRNTTITRLPRSIATWGLRNRWFADSSLEGNGFEPLVPRRRKKASSGSSTPRVRLGPQGDKGAKPCPLLREPEHNIPAASYSGIACRQALQDYRHFP